MSGHRNNPTDRGSLTNWRRQTERFVRTPKQSDRPRPTHILETANKATCQDTGKNRPTEAHTLAGDGRQKNWSGHGRKKTDQPRPTHLLETADKGTCQDTETIRPTEAHSPTGDGRQSDLSGHQKNPTNRGPRTNWRRQTERLVSTPKESHRLRPTHILETVNRGTCQDTETIRPTEAHSQTGDGRQRNLSGHRNNPTDRGPLTNWRRQTERLVRTPKESCRPRPTHILETADRGTC